MNYNQSFTNNDNTEKVLINLIKTITNKLLKMNLNELKNLINNKSDEMLFEQIIAKLIKESILNENAIDLIQFNFNNMSQNINIFNIYHKRIIELILPLDENKLEMTYKLLKISLSDKKTGK
jgi:hypothetical protein